MLYILKFNLWLKYVGCKKLESFKNIVDIQSMNFNPDIPNKTCDRGDFLIKMNIWHAPNLLS